MNVERLTRVLEDHGFTPDMREGGTEVSINCPLCFDEQDRLYINASTGLWLCFHCHSRGNLNQLGTDLLEMSGLEAHETAIAIRGPIGRDIPMQAAVHLPLPTESAGIELPEGFIWDDGTGMATRYFFSRDLNLTLVKKYQAGYVMQGWYAGRVVVPVMTNNYLRTWVARDWTDQAKKKVLMPKDSQAGRALFNYDNLPFNPENEGVVAVVEGVFDALRMITLGHNNVVATFGAHITDAQRRLLKRKGYMRVVILRDPDQAGRDAEIEEARELYAARFSVSIAHLPSGTDPGSASSTQLTAALLSAKTVDVDYGTEAMKEIHHG